jgi:hypothetical protein
MSAFRRAVHRAVSRGITWAVSPSQLTGALRPAGRGSSPSTGGIGQIAKVATTDGIGSLGRTDHDLDCISHLENRAGLGVLLNHCRVV